MQIVVDGIIFHQQTHGGIARIYREILPRIAEHHPITLLTHAQPSFNAPAHANIHTYQHPPLTPHWLQRLRPGRLWQPLLQARQQRLQATALQRHLGQQPAIWHSTYYTQPPCKLPRVVTVLDMIHERFPALFDHPSDHAFRARKAACIQTADAIIAISAATADDISHFYNIPRQRIAVIHLAASAAFHAPKNPIKPDFIPQRPFFLIVGRRTHHKNFLPVLNAYAQWSERHNVPLLTVGPAWDQTEQAMINQHQLADCVTNLTTVDDTQLCQLYHHAAALIYPSSYEGFGIPLVEAMHTGCPIIATPIPSSQEIAGDYPYYVAVDADTDTWQHTFAQAVKNRRSTAHVAAGKARTQQYHWQANADATQNIYTQLTG